MFDRTWDNLRVGTGAAGKDFEGLQENVRTVAKHVGTDIETIGGIVADLNTRLGISGDTMDTVAQQFAQLGTMGIDADINAVSAAINAFGVEADNMPAVMDDLFRVSQATGLSITDLANAAQSAAPALVPFGFSLSESAALAGQLDKAGINSSSVMEKLKKAFVEFAQDGREAPEAFRETIEEMKNFIEVGDIGAATNIAEKLFGSRGASDFVKAVQEGVFALDDLMGAAGVTGDTISDLYEQTKSFPEAWQEFKNAAMLALEPMATAIFDSLTGPLETAANFMSEYGGVIAPVAVALGVLAGALTTAAIAQGILNAVMALNPFVLIIAAIAALAAGLVVAYKKSETFRNIISGVGDAVGKMWEWVKIQFGHMLIKFEFAKQKLNELKQKAKNVFDAIKLFIDRPALALDYIKSKIHDVIDVLSLIRFPRPPRWITELFGSAPEPQLLGVPEPLTFLPRMMMSLSPELTASAARLPSRLAHSSPAAPATTNITVNVNGSVFSDERAIAKAVKHALDHDRIITTTGVL